MMRQIEYKNEESIKNDLEFVLIENSRLRIYHTSGDLNTVGSMIFYIDGIEDISLKVNSVVLLPIPSHWRITEISCLLNKYVFI